MSLLERVANLDPSEASVIAVVRPDGSNAVVEHSIGRGMDG